MKKKLISLAMAVAMIIPSVSCAKTKTPQLDGYKLLWSDEFDGKTMDQKKWNYEPHEPGWTNNELQEYTTSTDNVFVRDGKLVLKAIKTTKDGKDYYTSGKVTGQNKTDFQYGKVVVSAKVPEGQGLWPAIWMMPKDESFYGQWPKCGEIDIMESLGNDTTKSYSTIHYGEPHAEQQGTIVKEGADSFSAKFHEYSVEWEPGEMRFYTDGELVLTVNDWFTAVQGEDDKPYPAPFNQPFFVQMNLAVGGDWPGNPDSTTDFSKAEFEIDYVRVYQKPS
ncbi:MAG: glycoside hydrolase family 16 protein, partial [Clostridiales bacterium]|nr:glycoside hydrolase family 16 protein [Clostridiales bacterium]